MAVKYCPRCDRIFTNRNEAVLLEKLKKHVEEAHPDHDPNWWRDY